MDHLPRITELPPDPRMADLLEGRAALAIEAVDGDLIAWGRARDLVTSVGRNTPYTGPPIGQAVTAQMAFSWKRPELLGALQGRLLVTTEGPPAPRWAEELLVAVNDLDGPVAAREPAESEAPPGEPAP